MDDVLFTLGDLIQIALMLAACYACYIKGELRGIEETVTELIDRGLLDEKELEEMMKEEP
jgi:hypothetical protein